MRHSNSAVNRSTTLKEPSVQETTHVNAKRRLRALLALSAVLTVGVMAALATMPAQAAAAPVWDSEVFQGPTDLPPGGRGIIWVIPSNVGTDPSTAWPTVTFELPVGVTIAPPDPPFGWFCSGSPTVTCTNLFLGAAPVKPYTMTSFLEQISVPIRLTVEIAADAPQGNFPFDVTLAGGGANTATETHRVAVGPALGFGPRAGSFAAGAFDQAGNDYTQAGGHPYEATASFRYNTEFNEITAELGSHSRSILAKGLPRDVVAELPPGFVGNPTAGPKCPDLDAVQKRRCPAASQVGVATISPTVGPGGRYRMFGVYNVEPATNHPAELAFMSPIGTVLMVPSVRSNGNWGLNVSVRNITQIDSLFASSVTLWGVPADPSHDAQRCAALNYVAQACVGYDEGGTPISNPSTGLPADVADPHGSNAPLRPFLTNPTECSGSPLETRLHLSEYETSAPFDAFGDPVLSSTGWKSTSPISTKAAR